MAPFISLNTYIWSLLDIHSTKQFNLTTALGVATVCLALQLTAIIRLTSYVCDSPWELAHAG